LEKKGIITILESIAKSKSDMRGRKNFFLFQKSPQKWAGFFGKERNAGWLIIF